MIGLFTNRRLVAVAILLFAVVVCNPIVTPVGIARDVGGIGLPAFGQTATPVTLTIASLYADGTPLSGMWTVVSQNGAVAGSGFSPVTFSLLPGVTYTMTIANYQDITFYRWQDTNSTTASRTLSLSQTTTLKATYFSNLHPLPANPSQITLNVNAITQLGTAISGVYTVIKNGTATGPILAAKNTPINYQATIGQTYSVRPSDYEIFASGSYTFVQWSDGNTSWPRTVTPQADTALTAVYHNNPLGLRSIAARSAYTNGTDLTGTSFMIFPTPRATISPGYSPISWTLEADTMYTITPQDYGSYVFDHWQDGNVTKARTVSPATGLALISYYRLVQPDRLAPADQNPPTLTPNAPISGKIVTTSAVTISGTASDNIGVVRIDASIDNGPYFRADGLVRWSVLTPNLTDGVHMVRIQAMDAAGNSATASTTFNVASAPILKRTGVYIPMFISPTSSANLNFYDTVATVKRAHPSIPIVAAINPAGGPGTYQDPNFSSAINNLATSGVTVIGYTPTLYGSRNIDDIKSDISKYVAWYPGVHGIMLDEFANRAGYESKYANITAYAKGLGLQLVIGNAGTDTSQSYIGTVDAIGITEGDGYAPQAWLQHCIGCMAATANGWHYNYDKNNFWFARYAIDTLDPAYIREASKWAGLVYITNGVSPTRWDSLPPYFEQLVSALDTDTVPNSAQYPVTVMSDTTASWGSLTSAPRQFNGEYPANAQSALLGKKIDSITLSLQRGGLPVGLAQVGVFDVNLQPKKLFGTVDVSTLPTTSYVSKEFKLAQTDTLYTIQTGDRIGLKFTGGSSSAGVNVMIDRVASDPIFDGTNTQRVRYESGWLYYDTNEDMNMILQQTHG